MATIKEKLKDERPYEKCMRFGTESLTDAELLAIIIRSGTNNQNSVELAGNVLNMNGVSDGILGINHMSIHELMKIKGIGMVKAIQIKCVAELSRRIHREQYKIMPELCSPDSIANYYMEDLRHLETEHLYLVMLNTKHRLLGDIELSRGTVNSSIFSPREAFIEALRMGAVYLILMHNHPSGDPTPSREDITTTRRMWDAGNIIGIPLIDHIIIGDNRYISLKRMGVFHSNNMKVKDSN